MTDIKIDTSGPKETGINLHHLPVQIQHTGMAKVSSFFRIEPSEMKYEGKPVMEAAFRGRKLRGVNVAVPEQYNGVIFREDEPESSSPRRYYDDSEDQPDSGEALGPQRTWAIHATFDSFTYWTRQNQPSRQEKMMKWMEWASIAEKLHKPVTEADMAAPAKRARTPPAAKSSTENTNEEEKAADSETERSKKRQLDDDSVQATGDDDDEKSTMPPKKKRKIIEDEDDDSVEAKKLNRRHSMPANSSPKKISK